MMAETHYQHHHSDLNFHCLEKTCYHFVSRQFGLFVNSTYLPVFLQFIDNQSLVYIKWQLAVVDDVVRKKTNIVCEE